MKRRSGIYIMGRLIVMVRPLLLFRCTWLSLCDLSSGCGRYRTFKYYDG